MDPNSQKQNQAQAREGQEPHPQPPPPKKEGFFTRLMRKLTGRDRSSTKEIIINAEPLETRVAVMENNQLEELSVERTTEEHIVGSIYKGRVKNLENGLKAAFVDIGLEKNGFLHYWDIIPSPLDSSIEAVDREPKGGRREQKQRITQKDIPSVYPPGSDIVVQVTKGPISTKGPRLTTSISLPGRYLVLMPFSDQSGISRKSRIRRSVSDFGRSCGLSRFQTAWALLSALLVKARNSDISCAIFICC